MCFSSWLANPTIPRRGACGFFIVALAIVIRLKKKIERLLFHLDGAKNCLVFVDHDVIIPGHLTQDHCIVPCDDAAFTYGEICKAMWEEECRLQQGREYMFKNGYTIGQNVQLGQDVYIEPGAVIGHDVTIGDRTRIDAGAIVKNASIGKDCLIKSNAVIGMGSNVVKSVPDHATVMGNPAREREAKP